MYMYVQLFTNGGGCIVSETSELSRQHWASVYQMIKIMKCAHIYCGAHTRAVTTEAVSSTNVLRTHHSPRYAVDYAYATINVSPYVYQLRDIQGSLAEITNQRFSLKYQTFRQLPAAFISGSGLQSVEYTL